MIRKGQKIHGPDEQGYEAINDIPPGYVVHSQDFKAFGGAPEPEPGVKMPDWLYRALQARFNA
jgi:hypothetical protein